MSGAAEAAILEVRDLAVSYGAIKALKGISIRLAAHEIPDVAARYHADQPPSTTTFEPVT